MKIEIDYLKHIFEKVNKYPKAVIQNTLKFVSEKINKEKLAKLVNDRNIPIIQVSEATHNSDDELTYSHIILPFKGFKGENLIKSFKKALSFFLPKNVIPRFIYKGKKLGSFFPIKDVVSEKHRSDLIYGFHVPDMEIDEYHYIGETEVRNETRIYEHGHTDKFSSIYKHSREHNYDVSPSDFTILANGYHNWLDRKLCEALYVRDYKPFLNAQKNSHKLLLFA